MNCIFQFMPSRCIFQRRSSLDQRCADPDILASTSVRVCTFCIRLRRN